jgi:ABC-type transport system involved in multi-copper enzyme maturation permease subunit
MGVGVIAGLTIREAVRRKILLAALLLGAGFLILYGTGLYLGVADTPFQIRAVPWLRRQILTALLLMGLYAVNWLSVMITILISVDTLAGEISSGTIQSVVTKPIRRWEVVLGKYAGFAAMLVPYIGLMAGGVMLEMRAFTGELPAGVLRALPLMWAESLLLLAVTFRAGASLSTLATGVLAIGLHVLAFLGGWIEEFGSMAGSQTAVNIGVLASLVMPSESLWRRAAFDVQGRVVGNVRTPFHVASVPSEWMMLYAAVFLIAMFGLAVRRFSRRDL